MGNAERNAEVRRRLEEPARHDGGLELAEQAIRERIGRRHLAQPRKRDGPSARLHPFQRRLRRHELVEQGEIGFKNAPRPRGQRRQVLEGHRRRALGQNRAGPVHEVPHTADLLGNDAGRERPSASKPGQAVRLRQAARS